MFQFPGFPSLAWFSSLSVFPHSDICGSRLICSSPQLFAACHVLLRRLMPRHPPYALICFVFRDTSVSPCPCSNVSFLQDSFLANIVRSMSPYYSTLFALLVSLFVFVLCSCQCAIPRKKNISPVLPIPYAQTRGIYSYLARIQRLLLLCTACILSSYGAALLADSLCILPYPICPCQLFLCPFLNFFYFFYSSFFLRPTKSCSLIGIKAEHITIINTR